MSAKRHLLDWEQFSVQSKSRAPLVAFVRAALTEAGCKIVVAPETNVAPFRFVVDLPSGERHGFLCYAFTATFTPTKNRPDDEHSFQIKYGSKEDDAPHDLWQDPSGLHTTLVFGVNVEHNFFVGIDPVLNSPTRFFVRFEYKQEHVDAIQRDGWHVWERVLRRLDAPHQVVVGGTRQSFLRYALFERRARGLDQGHRQLLAEAAGRSESELNAVTASTVDVPATPIETPVDERLVEAFGMSSDALFELIQTNARLLMAVRGGVAERHLLRVLSALPGVTECHQPTGDFAPDVSLRFMDQRLLVECKNVLRTVGKDGIARMDLMKTRASQNDPCSRFYRFDQFDLVAGCLHAQTQRWDFRYVLPGALDEHGKCEGRIAPRVRLDDRWTDDVASVLSEAAVRKRAS